MSAQDPFAAAAVNPYENMTPHQRIAYKYQQGAIEAMRSRQAAAQGPTVLLPFGRQEPLRKYVGMNVIPTRKNPFVDQPEVILKEPQPGWHYGFVKYDERARGMFRAHQYEPVYEDELLTDNDVPYSVEDVLTEKGPMKLCIWHGLVMFKIPPSVWLREFELPALQSAARLTQHKEGFNEGRLGGQEVVRQINDGVPEYTHAAHEMRVDRSNVRVAMAIGDNAAETVDRVIGR